MPSTLLRLGTRGSPLALWQAHAVRDALAAAHGTAPEAIEIVVIRTSGDMIQDRPLAEAGGKGAFTKEIEERLLEGTIDIAVHSAKDVPTYLPGGLVLAGYLPRADARDAFIGRDAMRFEDLPEGARLGTVSLRRQALARRLRPDLEVVMLRGNVGTRLDKLARGEVDATLLAVAGLTRLGLLERADELLDTRLFVPAVGQGAVAIEQRGDDVATTALLAPILDAATGTALACERAFLAVLDGSCRTPIAGHATLDGDTLTFHGLVLSEDGRRAEAELVEGRTADAAALGRTAGEAIRARAPELVPVR